MLDSHATPIYFYRRESNYYVPDATRLTRISWLTFGTGSSLLPTCFLNTEHGIVAAHFSPHFFRIPFGRFRWTQNNCHRHLGRSGENETTDPQGRIIIVANNQQGNRCKSRKQFSFILLRPSKHWMVRSLVRVETPTIAIFSRESAFVDYIQWVRSWFMLEKRVNTNLILRWPKMVIVGKEVITDVRSDWTHAKY